MQFYEYRVVPAPRRGEKSREARTTADRLALTIGTLMNEMAADGWEYLRADTLPSEERSGLTGKTTTFQNLLVFRRAKQKHATVSGAVQVAPLPTPVTSPVVPRSDEEAEFRLRRVFSDDTDTDGTGAPHVGPARD